MSDSSLKTTRRGHPAYLLLFVALVAPIGAVVVVTALLLFGVAPHTVFAPGWAVKSLLESAGLRHVPNAVGVASTVGLWWLFIVAAGLAWDWGRRRGRS